MKIENVIRKRIPDDGEHLYGFADLTGLLHQRFQGYDYGIVIGKKLEDSIVDSASNGPTMEYYNQYIDTNNYLAGLVKELAEDLGAAGIKSLPINPTPNDVYRADDYDLTLRHNFSLKMVATRAGLGWIGKTDLFISKKFGPRLRLASVLVDYPLKPLNQPIDESRCGKCNLCVEACPAKAASGQLWNIRVDRDEFYSVRKCKETANRLTLERIGKDERICSICVSVCPVGQSGPYAGDFNSGSATITQDIEMKVASMSRACLVTASLILLALVSCAPKTPSSAVNSTPTPVTTPDSTPRTPPSERVPRITIDELLQKIGSHADILIVDSRLDVEELFDAGHINGAIPVPLSKIIEGQWLPPADKEIIFYCT